MDQDKNLSPQLEKIYEESWGKWSKYVLHTLEQYDKRLENIEKCQIEIKGDIRELKVKAGIWGLVGGCIPTAAAILIGVVIWIIRMKP